MMGAHLEYIGLYHWRLTGKKTVELIREERMRPDLTIANKWLVIPLDPEHTGGPGEWDTAAHALAHAFSLATHGDCTGGPVAPILEAIKSGRIAAGAAP